MNSVLQSLYNDLKITGMRNKTKFWSYGILGLVLAGLQTGCVDKYIPETLDALDRDINFTTTFFEPVMGHTTIYTNIFSSGNSTLPLTFEIQNMRHSDGTPAPELQEYYPVKVWDKPYLGTEASIEEINAKRKIEYRRLFDIRKHSGEIVLWGEANSSIIRCQPDSGYVFDVIAQNSGGYKYTKSMRLMPKREVDFEPSIYDPETGLAVAEYVTPTSSSIRKISEDKDKDYFYMMDLNDIHIYFREDRNNKEPGGTLKLSFHNPDWSTINPKAFNETNWDNLFQAGFLRKESGLTDEYVLYDMAYPLPLFEERTTYTTEDGKKAHISLATSFVRKSNYSSYRVKSYLNFDFAIYKEAHWQILFHFYSARPKLGDIK